MKKIFFTLILLFWGFISLASAEEKFFEIRAKQFNYTPNIIKVRKGDLVKVRLISEDVTHGMFVDGYGVNTSAHPGQEGSLKFVANKQGRFSFRCSVTCGEFHPYMIGYLVVEDNMRFIGYLFLIILIGGLSILFIIFKKPTEIPKETENAQQG